MTEKIATKKKTIATTDHDGSLSMKVEEIIEVLNRKQGSVIVNQSILIRSLVISYHKKIKAKEPVEINLDELI